jgi:hypothetical protein
VKKSGPTPETWKKLGQLLNRQKTFTLTNRYRLLTTAKLTGHWTLQDDEIFLEHFFAGKIDSNAQIIRDISTKNLKELEEKLDRYYF